MLLQTLSRCAMLLMLCVLLSACGGGSGSSAVNNTPPVANAGSGQSVTLPATVTLDGSASSDADGNTLTYAWTLTTVPTGSTAALSSATAAKPTFVPDLPGTYTARLIVSDGTTTSAPATVTISVSMTVSLVTNGSFEASLTGWSQGVGPASPSGTSCGWNPAAPAPGTETVTGTAGFPTTDGTNNVIGGLIQTAAGQASCVLYQDITIPAGATTMDFSVAVGIKYLGGKLYGNSGVYGGLYPTSAIPDSTSPRLIGNSFLYEPTTSDSTLTTITLNSINVSSFAGQTVRLAFINASDSTTGSSVAGVDNVKVTVVVTH